MKIFESFAFSLQTATASLESGIPAEWMVTVSLSLSLLVNLFIGRGQIREENKNQFLSRRVKQGKMVSF